MNNKFIGGLLGLSLLGACQDGGVDQKTSDPGHTIYTSTKKSELNDTLALLNEYKNTGDGGMNQNIIDKITINEGTIYPEIEKAMFEAATYNMEYKKDTINGDSITISWGDKFLDMPVGCSFMLQLICNKWVTYQDLLYAANNHDMSFLVAKVFNRTYPEGPLTREQEQQKKEDEDAFIKMSLTACKSDNYDIVDEYMFWIQTIREEVQ